MRDPKRIPRVLAAIEKLWRQEPDLRLMQLLLNFCAHHGGGHYSPDPYFMEDNRLLELLTPEGENGERMQRGAAKEENPK